MDTPRRAVLFDLDGTLLDSLGDLAESMNAVLREHSLPTHGLDDYRYFIGDGMRELVRRSLPTELHDPRSMAHFLDHYRASYEQRWHLSKPFPGVPELLDGLQERGIALAVISNKPDAFTQKCVERLFPGWRWDAVAGQVDGLPRKPDPTGALGLAARMEVSAEACWLVGDTRVDMETAVAAGMCPVGVTWGFRTEDELRGAGAAVLIDKPAEFLQVIERERS